MSSVSGERRDVSMGQNRTHGEMWCPLCVYTCSMMNSFHELTRSPTRSNQVILTRDTAQTLVTYSEKKGYQPTDIHKKEIIRNKSISRVMGLKAGWNRKTDGCLASTVLYFFILNGIFIYHYIFSPIEEIQHTPQLNCGCC